MTLKRAANTKGVKGAGESGADAVPSASRKRPAKAAAAEPPAKAPKRPGAAAAASPEREALEKRWFDLMKQELPAAARGEEGWPIRLDHCFMRVALDNAFGQCWYEVLDQRKGAVKSMSDAQLQGAVAVAEAMLKNGKSLVVEMNMESLRFRKKGPFRPAA